MKRLALILLGLGALAAPGSAWAAPAQLGSWLKSGQAGATTKALKGGEFATYRLPAASDDESASPVIQVSDCENFDIWMHDDPDGSGANACTVTWEIDQCPPAASGTADAAKNNSCAKLPGSNDLSGDDVESNMAGEFIRVHGMNAGANIENCLIVLKCALGAGQ